MSSTVLYYAKKQIDSEKQNWNSFSEIGNSWRGGMFFWRYIEEKYLPSLPKPDWMTGREKEYVSRFTFSVCGDSDGLNEVWGLFTDKRLSRSERIVLGTTLDHGYILFEDIPFVVNALNEVYAEMGENSSLAEQASALNYLYIHHKDVYCVVWLQTSVSCIEDVHGEYFGEKEMWNIIADVNEVEKRLSSEKCNEKENENE